MKRFFMALCLITSIFQMTYAQDNGLNHLQGDTDNKEVYRRRELFANSKKELNEKAIDRVDNLKTLVGKTICLRPDYEFLTLKIERQNVVPVLGTTIKESYAISHSDALTVVKAKKGALANQKPELTVKRNDEEIKIQNYQFRHFMLVSDRDEMLIALDTKQRTERENAEKAERAKAEAEKEANLAAYHKSIREMHEMNDGPIAVSNERAYDGTKPYRKFSSSGFDSYKDEKFVINQRVFKRDYQKLMDKYKGDARDYYRQLEKLSTMQADTFGLFKDNQTFINLRTGDVIRGYTGSTFSLWESTNYLDNLNALPPITYDATESMKEFLGDYNKPYRERYIDALIGERVFLLDDLKYDIITDIDDNYGDDILYFQNHEPLRCRKDKCVSVKWYEKLQTVVGKKVVKAGDIRFYGYDDTSTTWKEDLADLETYTVEKFELTKDNFSIYLTGRGCQNVFDWCDILTYPINVEEEWKQEMLGQKNKLHSNNYISYDAALATTPKKPTNVKKQEAETNAWLEKVSKDFSDLRNHKYIGTSLDAFLQKWSSAQLINTTSKGGATIKVYSIKDLQHEYLLIFKNGKCVSQTKL